MNKIENASSFFLNLSRLSSSWDSEAILNDDDLELDSPTAGKQNTKDSLLNNQNFKKYEK